MTANPEQDQEWCELELDQLKNEHEWTLAELELLKADNADLERENRRMSWALSVRMALECDLYNGRTLLDEYKDLTPEFWERMGL